MFYPLKNTTKNISRYDARSAESDTPDANRLRGFEYAFDTRKTRHHTATLSYQQQYRQRPL